MHFIMWYYYISGAKWLCHLFVHTIQPRQLLCQHKNHIGKGFNPFTPRVSYGDIKVILTWSLWMKSYGVTIERKPLQQYFHMVLFIF